MGKLVDKEQLELLKTLANSKEGDYIACPNTKCENCVLFINSTDCYGLLSKREEGIKFAKEYLEKYIKEDNMEKNFREVIRDIKDGEVWESENNSCDVRIIKDMTGIQIRDFKDNALVFFSDSWKFKLKRKQYNFTDAFKAYEEGKEIESCVSGNCYGGEYIYSNLIAIKDINGEWFINN